LFQWPVLRYAVARSFALLEQPGARLLRPARLTTRAEAA
jgi:hypothetical protein